MARFIGEKIEVERDERSPRPISFVWRGQTYDVTEVLHEWVDTGFGTTPPASRVWYNRRHRRYFVVLTSAGEVFRLYFDYADKRDRSWWLVSRGDDS